VLQSSDGYIWFGTYTGLVRYDGKSFQLINHSTEETFAGTSIRALFEDSHGRLWIGTNESGIICYENGVYTTFDKEDGAPANSIRMIEEATNGDIVVASTAGIFTINGNNELELISTPGLEGAFVVDIEYGENESFLAVTESGELLVHRKGVIEFFSSDKKDLSRYEFTCVSSSADGVFYLGTSKNKVIELTFDGSSYSLVTMKAGNLATINEIFRDSNGRLWICADNGIGYFDNSKFHEMSDVLMDNSVEEVMEDYEGNMWFVSSRQGVLQLSKSRFTDFSLENGLDELVVNTTAIYDNKTYIGSDTGLLILNKNGFQVTNILTEMLTGIRIRCLLPDSSGYLWICTYQDFGIIRYSSDGSYINFNMENGLPSNKIRSAIERKNGDILLVSDNTISIISNGEIIKSYNENQGLGKTGILSLYETNNGVIYAGTDGDGVLRIEGDKITSLTEDDGLAAGVILRLTGDPKFGGIWASTGNTLCYIDDSGIRKIDKVSTSGSIFDILFTADGKMWLLTENEIIVTSSENLLDTESELKYEAIKKKSGLSSSITANSWAWLDNDGTLYLCCGSGVNCINTLNYVKGSTNAHLIINNISVDDTIYTNPGGKITIPSNATRVAIDTALLSFMPAEMYNVTYYLEGQDQEKRSISAHELSEISYTNLSGGNYTFHMQALDFNGNTICDELILYVNKDYKLFERTSVKIVTIILILLAAIALVITILYTKTKSLKKRQSEYKAITDQAISTIANTIDAKDPNTKGHSIRVATFSVEIGKRLNLDEERIEHLYYTALLHDIGKVGIPDEILKKPAALTDDEFKVMKQHPEIGGDILRDIIAIKDLSRGAREHHERYDGRGYVQGLVGEEISLEGRIICAADSYDAMASKRAYRDELTKEKIINEFTRCRGFQFDPQIADIVKEMIETGYFDSYYRKGNIY